MGGHRMRVGLLLRKAMLRSYLLFSAEAWSAVSESELYRLEQVDSALLKSLAKGHSKTFHISLFRIWNPEAPAHKKVTGSSPSELLSVMGR